MYNDEQDYDVYGRISILNQKLESSEFRSNAKINRIRVEIQQGVFVSFHYNEVCAVIIKIRTDLIVSELLLPDFIVLPNGTDRLPIIGIGPQAFENAKIIKVELPALLNWIGARAFYKSHLQEIEIPQYVNLIDVEAFSSCSALRKVKIMSDIRRINNGTFSSCINLEDISFAASTLDYIGISAFECCEKLKIISISYCISISNSAFRCCYNLETMIKAQEYGEYSYYSCEKLCKISSCTVDNNGNQHFDEIKFVRCNISESAFGGCISLGKENEIQGRGIIAFSYSRIGPRSFNGCNSIWKIELYDNSLSSNAFENCENLLEVRPLYGSAIIDGSRSIPQSIFKGCRSLKKFEIPEGIITISCNSFCGCTSLKEIIIPSTVLEIDFSAFRDCKSLIIVNNKSQVPIKGNINFDID